MKREKLIATIVCIICLLFCLSGCSSSNDYANTLRSGYSKYQNGQKMSYDEYKAVQEFNQWRDKQGEKTYSGWGN